MAADSPTDPDLIVLMRLAEEGDAKAQLFVAQAFAEGDDGLPANKTKALMWTKRAADQGYPNAFVWMGIAYHSGSLAPVDLDEAERWYQRALGPEGRSLPRSERASVRKALRHIARERSGLVRGPEVFVTDKHGERFYESDVRFGIAFWLIVIPVCIGILWVGDHWGWAILTWASIIAVAWGVLSLCLYAPRYFGIMREKSYRARDRAEAEALSRPLSTSAAQQPHGAALDDMTI